jgi:DNA-binding transcriptional LysR family regulator
VTDEMAFADKVTAEITYTTMQMLTLFEEKRSFTLVGKELDLPPRSVADRLRKLDHAWSVTNRADLLIHEEHSKSWSLTPAGIALAIEFRQLVKATQTAMNLVKGRHRVNIECTRSCLGDFAFLADAVKGNYPDITIEPVSRRSAEIEAESYNGGAPFYLFSSLRNLKTDPFVRGGATPLEKRTRLDLRSERLALLVSSGLRLPSGPITPSILLAVDRDAVIMTPQGGVAWEYLASELGVRWELKRPNNLFVINDLDFGLRSIATGALGERHTMMVVHGWEQADLVSRGLQNYAALREVDTRHHDWAAVTSLIRYTGRDSFGDEATEHVWETATKNKDSWGFGQMALIGAGV